VGRVKDNLEDGGWDESMQKPLVVVGVLAVSETGDDIDLSVWQNSRYCPRVSA